MRWLTPMLKSLGYLLIVMGVISWGSPIPGGTIMLAAGLSLLICTSEATARFIGFCRKRFSWLNRAMNFIASKSPAPLRNALERTEPDQLDT